jgi:4,5-DOPA dioxygenase extradiol
MSPHWMSRGLEVMAALQPETWHDFGGFPRVLYSLQYPAPGAPLLAQQVAQLLQAAGQQPVLNPERPMDHGAWVPLMHLFPQADVPVVQLSLPADADAAAVYALGQALRPLRDAGVLLVGSGSMTHNLRDFVTGKAAAGWTMCSLSAAGSRSASGARYRRAAGLAGAGPAGAARPPDG